jgi:glycosyltransferase involved in cell wall biosynthesis
MKILLINQYAGAPSLGMEFRPHWMASEIIARGHQVLIVTANHSHLRSRVLPIGPQQIEGVPFRVLRTSAYSINGIKRFMNIISFRYQLYANKGILQNWKPDIVIASSTHPLDVRPAAKIARITGARFVYEVHDLWPLTPILIGGFTGKHPMIRWMSKEESFGYKCADLVVSLLPNTREYMVSRGLDANKWIWIPNGVSSLGKKEVPPSSHIASIAQLRESFQRIIIYAGTIGPANKLDILIEIANIAAKIGIAFVIVGDGPEKVKLQHLSREYSNIVWLDKINRNAVDKLLSLADVAYAGLDNSPLFYFGISPNKIFDYFSAGLPVIENVQAPNSPTFESGAGWQIDSENGASFEDLLRKIAGMQISELKNLGNLGRIYLGSGFYQHQLTDKLLTAFNEVLIKGEVDRN